jgi:hypothetical protein
MLGKCNDDSCGTTKGSCSPCKTIVAILTVGVLGVAVYFLFL